MNIKHWVKTINSNQYNGNMSSKISLIQVPTKHKLTIGDVYYVFDYIYTLKEKRTGKDGTLHLYWEETKNTKNIGVPGVFKKK